MPRIILVERDTSSVRLPPRNAFALTFSSLDRLARDEAQYVIFRGRKVDTFELFGVDGSTEVRQIRATRGNMR